MAITLDITLEKQNIGVNSSFDYLSWVNFPALEILTENQNINIDWAQTVSFPLNETSIPEPQSIPFLVFDELFPAPGSTEVPLDSPITVVAGDAISTTEVGAAEIGIIPETADDELLGLDPAQTIITAIIDGTPTIIFENGAPQAGWSATVLLNDYAGENRGIYGTGRTYQLTPPSDYPQNAVIEIEVRLVDYGNNSKIDSFSFSTITDAVPPQVIWKNPDDGGTIRREEHLTFSITDDNQVNPASIEIIVNGLVIYTANTGWIGDWSSSSIIANTSIHGFDCDVFPAGGWRGMSTEFEIRVIAEDTAGNTCDESWTISRERKILFDIYKFIFEGIRKIDEEWD